MADTDAIMLVPVPLTGERFAPYGDVIEALPGTSSSSASTSTANASS